MVAPASDGSTLHLPAIDSDTRGDTQWIYLWTSTDGGNSFTEQAGKPLRTPGRLNAGADPIATHGDDIWVAARGTLFESTDRGHTWTVIPTVSGVTDLSLIDATHAIPVIVDSGCHHHKSDCYNHTYLAATNDSGRTWQTIQASPDAGRANAQNTQRQPAATGPGSAQYSAITASCAVTMRTKLRDVVLRPRYVVGNLHRDRIRMLSELSRHRSASAASLWCGR